MSRRKRACNRRQSDGARNKNGKDPAKHAHGQSGLPAQSTETYGQRVKSLLLVSRRGKRRARLYGAPKKGSTSRPSHREKVASRVGRGRQNQLGRWGTPLLQIRQLGAFRL
jgi:hypothetical protein